MKSFPIIPFVIALVICAALFLMLDVALFNAQGISFRFNG